MDRYNSKENNKKKSRFIWRVGVEFTFTSVILTINFSKTHTFRPMRRWCKIFRNVKETYRGKHKHYHKVWTVVAALANLRYAA